MLRKDGRVYQPRSQERPMRDDEGFLSAIKASPTEDLPRLIYADYLDDRGDHARAEFIRIGCARARQPENYSLRRRLAERELELLADHQAEWELPYQPATLVRFDRGFVSAIEIEAAGFVRQYVTMLAAGPLPAITLRNAWE